MLTRTMTLPMNDLPLVLNFVVRIKVPRSLVHDAKTSSVIVR